MKKIIAIFIGFCLVTFPLISLGKSEFALGTFLHYNYNLHTAEFNKLDGVPNCCPLFQSGIGSGYTIGALIDLPLFQSDISMHLKFDYSTIDGTLLSNENEDINLDGSSISGMFEHSIEAELSTVAINPTISYNLIENINISVGTKISYLTGYNFQQMEKLKKPSNSGVFWDSGTRTRNDTSGIINNTSQFLFFLTFGISYELPMNSNRTIMMIPELNYNLPLNSILKNKEWKVHSLMAGISLKYIFQENKLEVLFRQIEIIDTVFNESPYISKTEFIKGINRYSQDEHEEDGKRIISETINRTDTIISPKKVNMSAELSAVGVKNGIETVDFAITIEEYQIKNMVPLLNYIFFEKDSDSIPNRYKLITNEEISSFYIDSLYNISTLDVYYNLLNIIGRRMKANPNAEITLTGCSSTDEDNDMEYSRRRAKAIYYYLIDTWGISPERLNIESRSLPEDKSSESEEKGKEENRRVEISSANKEILKPLIISKLNRTSDPPALRFYLNVLSDSELKQWKLFVLQAKDTLRIFSGDKIIPNSIDWNLNEGKENFPFNDTPLEYFLTFEDIYGNIGESDRHQLKLKRITKGKILEEGKEYSKIENYNLIIFKFNQPEITVNNLEIIKFIRENINDKSEIIVSGYTDELGDEEYNLNLSKQRAMNVVKYLKLKNIEVYGRGETVNLFNNDLPEGRFYSRTVNILVKTASK